MIKELTVIQVNGQLFVDSREVADMTNVRHSDLLEKIDVYVTHLTNGKFRSSDFFIESSYMDTKGETRRCYLLTRKGCDMVANKMTGEKGVLFTASYVTKFEEMERALNKPMSQLEIMQMAINQLVEHDQRLLEHDGRIGTLEESDKVINQKVEALRDGFQKYTIRPEDKSAYVVADKLKLYSKNGSPHFNFVDAVAKKLGFYKGVIGVCDSLINVIMDNTHNGNSGVAVYYTDKAIDHMKEYLDAHFTLKINTYKRDSGDNKKGDPKEYVFSLFNKNWGFHKKTYIHYDQMK
ncbi:Rha family transcriptional regulator [Brevibacillus sp. NRS-1366]|uniref:Rha family transcriptional regulator n=1 Tax=Brevibacillus sp. NRS-1366 TaxID=3233899 RepID=UPI003D239CD1